VVAAAGPLVTDPATATAPSARLQRRSRMQTRVLQRARPRGPAPHRRAEHVAETFTEMPMVGRWDHRQDAAFRAASGADPQFAVWWLCRLPTRYIPGMPLLRAQGPNTCEECGAILESGREPNSPHDDVEAWQAGETERAVVWCPNLDCASNQLKGLHRVGVNRYVCTVCGKDLSGPMSQIFGHRRTH
jgi:hypothetical protein